MKQFKYGQKSFETKKELHRYLVENKEFEINRKKSVVKCADPISFSPLILSQKAVNKAVKPVYENDEAKGVLKRTILTNTYWWMDSHSDVHIGRREGKDVAIFSDTIQKRMNKIYPMDQHKYSLDGRIGKTRNLFEATIAWKDLGVDIEGETEGLFAEAEIQKVKNAARYNDYLNNEIDQHSVGMQYIDVQLAVNDSEEFPEEYEVYKKYFPNIANKEAVEEQGFFFAVLVAKLIEYSCVIEGSNELTPVLLPSEDTTEKTSEETLKALTDLSTRIEVVNKLNLLKQKLK